MPRSLKLPSCSASTARFASANATRRSNSLRNAASRAPQNVSTNAIRALPSGSVFHVPASAGVMTQRTGPSPHSGSAGSRCRDSAGG